MGLDEIQQRELNDLIRKRGVVKAALTRIRTFLSRFNPREDAITLLQFRQEELPQINKRFEDIQSQIELIDYENVEKAEIDRDMFESEYYAIRSEIQEIINLEKTINSSSLNNSSLHTTVASHRPSLAPISLPKFSGNILEWEPYFDCFKVLVHNEDYYSAAQKFSYLRSSLSGQALDMIKAIPMSESNYEVAIRKLKNRYDNKGLVIQTHIRNILDCPSVKMATSTSLQDLFSLVSTHVAALEALGQPIEHWDAWLITVVLRKLDTATIHSWQIIQTKKDLPKYTELEKFLASQCVAFESSESWASNSETNGEHIPLKSTTNMKKVNVTNGAKKSLAVSRASTEDRCVCCTESHRLYSCNKFKEMVPKKRAELVRQNKLCFNCLSPYHRAGTCRSQFVCQKCKGKHNTLIHYDREEEMEPEVEEKAHDSSSIVSTETTEKSSLMAQHVNSHVFLATACVFIKDNFGNQRKCRVVLDSGSQVNFISKKLAHLLQIPAKRASLPISGIGAQQIRAGSYVDVSIQSRTNNYQLDLQCYILPNMVTDLASCIEPKDGWKIPEDLSANLADPDFYQRRGVDILIGGGVFFDILGSERRVIGTGPLSLQDSCFGWIVTGELEVNCMIGIKSVGKVLEEEWKAEIASETTNFGRLSKSNQRCLEEQEASRHFQETVVRNEQGRFVLKLPLKPEVSILGDTLNMATSRFMSVERRLQRDESLKEAYISFMEEYEKAGHMIEIIKDTKPKKVFYLPHHPVFKATSLTTKLRVVFDASAKSSSGTSLNEVLMQGPTVQEDLFAILVRFRIHHFALTADVEKMFRQVKIASEDQDLQRIVWRTRPSEALRSYKLTTVTYGTTPASFMATQCLVELAKQHVQAYPEASKIIEHDFYMDDLLTGAETTEECIVLQQQISFILNSAKLPLRKWCSNSDYILKNVKGTKKETLYVIHTDTEDVIKSLGLCWKPSQDEFEFQVLPIPMRAAFTKRMLLSDLNKIFDPLGFLTPVLIKGKIFLQQLWQLKINWDMPLPDQMKIKWGLFYQELEQLGSIQIPRKCKPYVSKYIELHGFCDASTEAYGACIFVRSKDDSGRWHARLLCSKSRVAPLKGATIPRLELCAALVLTILAERVAVSWNLNIAEFNFWTDSTVVLGWLNSQASRLKTYVANRIDQILEVTQAKQWRHVKTTENPADLLSRGVSVQNLKISEIWWSGPQWLSNNKEDWDQPDIVLPEEETLPERRPIKLVLVGVNQSKELINSYSSWKRLVRATSWILKFIEYRKGIKIGKGCSKFLSVADLKRAESGLIRQTQRETFGEDLHALERNREVPRCSKLKTLYPLLRNDSVIIVGGRLNNAQISEDKKHPIVLPAKHKVTRLIFEDFHQSFLHCGPQALLAYVRQKYWPLKGRIMARAVTTHCVTCLRARPKFEYPLMAALPKHRVRESRPFTITGVDFAGPLLIRSGIRRVTAIKTWIAVFVCFSTRAIHLEAVVGLTSEAFLAALRRFMSRRGKCTKIYSDNGTNFVGARKELSTYLVNSGDIMAREGVDWHLNPPSAPHFGGIWESAVKSTKSHLIRVLKDTRLNLEELQTLLCQVEACVNSRPMTPLGSDPNEPDALTPAHFLIGGSLLLPPEPSIPREELGHLKKWKFVQGLMQSFWKRWYDEYLPQLQVRGRWLTSKRELIINDVVVVKEDCAPPTKWKLGRVIKTHPGSDGRVRVVTLRTSAGADIQRPVVKLCRLPVEAEDHEVEN